ncbi:MAG: ATP-binding protein [Bacillota bacterium]
MKKVNLSFMAVMIISLIIILIMNTMAVFAYHNEVLAVENRKENMLNFNIKYNKLLENIHSNAKQYLLTNDERYKSEFYNLLNNYRKNDSISLDYRVFTRKQASPSLEEILINTDFTISSQADYIQFNKEEQRLYSQFLSKFNILLNFLTDAVSSRNTNLLTGSEYEVLYMEQSQIMTGLSKIYIDRLNQKEDSILLNQKFLKYSLVCVSLLLLCFAAVTFYLIIKENAYNAYFSKLYNTVVENMDGGIAILDANYHFDYMNSKYKEIFGISEGNSIGKSLHDTFDQGLASMIENTIMDDHNFKGKLDIIVGTKKRNIVYSYLTIDDERGNNKYVHLIRDTTKTEELQLQLRKQLKDINYYSQAKDSFIANISHEIKTPINAILGMVHFLKSTRLSQNQKELVRKIETSSDILLTIISDVLDLSKIKNNSLSLYPSDFSLEMVIKNIEDMFSNQLSLKGLEWRTEYDFSRDLCIHLDKTRFVQVLVNLINNACKFTDKGFIKLSVETISENNDMVLLQFCVEDTGIGIAEKDISKLFREFEQLENHLTKQHQGTGLGLYICKNIIESMDGRMWVKSTKGMGSQFYFTLPAKKGLEQHLNAVTNLINTTPLDGNGGKALVVDDTEINAEVAVKLLNDVNIACDTASDGLAAIEMCSSKPSNYYNVILMDIHMPVMDGYTAANILKKEVGVTCPILALTASDINDQIRTEHAHTIESFILKPFKAAAFYKAVAPYFPNRNEQVIKKDMEEGQNHSMKKNAEKKSTEKKEAVKRKDPFAGREEAIKNLGGMEAIYNKHIIKFKVNYANSTENITGLLGEKNYDEARRLAHSLKGLGGTLGMLDVMEASAELEKAIMRGEVYDLSVELENFDKELKAAIAAI